jgi:excisionase family DNA binding protein
MLQLVTWKTCRKGSTKTDKYYTAGEAIRKLKIPKSTFYDLIKKGEIPEGVKVPLRKQALYRRSDIDKLVEERARYLEEIRQEPERLTFMPPNREDLEQLKAIDLMVFHEETLISPEKQLERFKYNPEAILVLKDRKTNTVLGGITMSPIKQEVLEKLINLEIDETQIQPEDYRPYTTDHPQDCYLVGIIARPGTGEKFYAGRLMKAALDYLIRLLDRGIIVRRIYTVATTRDGDKLAQNLHLTPLPGETKTKYEEFRRPYVLDLEVRESQSSLVNRYLKQRRNLERRRKRYQKRALEEREL